MEACGRRPAADVQTMCDVTLINPPAPYLADPKASPPLGLLYVADALERAGIGVRVLDLAEDPDYLAKAAAVDSPVIGAGCVTPNYRFVREIAAVLPRGAVKIVGGPHPSALPGRTLDELGFDVVVAGEAETIIADLALDLLAGRRTERIVHGPPTPPGEIGIPARYLLDMRDYSPEMTADSATTVITSRGCPFRCGFCYKMYDHKLVRYHPLEVVEREIGILAGEYGFRNLVLTDDNFLGNRGHFNAIAGILKSNGVKYRCVGRADSLTEKALETLVETGCTEISFGVESGSQKILDRIGKKMSVDKQKAAILAAKRAGITAKAYFVVGVPGEDETTVEETKRFFEEALPDKWLLSTFSPLPGSDAFVNPEKYGITRLSEDFGEYWYVGNEGLGGRSFDAEGLDPERVREFNRELFDFFQSRVPMKRAARKNPENK